jgi:transcriptional regulator with PAS, ATPase and Fis domain
VQPKKQNRRGLVVHHGCDPLGSRSAAAGAANTPSACMNRLSSPTNVQSPGEELLVGHCENLLHVRNLIRRIAPADMTVLIMGETGTGKELAAHAIHDLSPRRNGPFVSVNCAAIPDSLLESELFGFEKGAFTGATIRQQGKLRAAHRGTIFLDEIGDMSLQTQAKILRTIESQEIQPLGETRNISIDVRVVAATHQNLERLISEQKFRADLFFRLNVLPVYLPPLRERRDDIPELADRFIRELNQRYGRCVAGVTKGGLRLLRNQDWPGNVRQLRNVIEGAFLICSSQFITAADLRWLHWTLAKGPHLTAQLSSQEVPHVPVAPEPDRVLEALQATRWNKSKAAEILRCSRMTVYRRIAKYRLQQEGPLTDSQPDGGLAPV